MSLRPAQELVAESSKFSLRSFFDKPPSGQAEPVLEGLPTLNTSTDGLSSTAALPQSMQSMQSMQANQSTPTYGSSFPKPATSTMSTIPKENKFTFNGLMPATTPRQIQHKLILQAQQASLQSASTKAPLQQDANEIMRLKAQVLSLTDRANQLNANLASTSDSVVKGNKALMSERAQFHAKYASLTKKLESTQAALTEAEALPKEAIKNANLLNSKILELQEENAQLTQTRADLEKTLGDKRAELAVATAAAATTSDADLEAMCNSLQQKYAALAAQHAALLDTKHQMEEQLDQHMAMLTAAHVQLEEANSRVKASQVEIEAQTLCLEQATASLAESQGSTEAFKAQIDASHLEVAHTDSLVDTLDAKLADLRAQYVDQEQEQKPVDVACCCPRTMRCEDLEKVAREARKMAHLADDSSCEMLVEEARFHEAVAKRARACLEDGTAERIMIAHIYTGNDGDAFDAPLPLARSVRNNPLPMGAPFDDTFLQCQVEMHCCGQEVERSATVAAAEAVPVMDNRTTAFVKAVSEDLKLQMQDSQQLYKNSSTTGAALKL